MRPRPLGSWHAGGQLSRRPIWWLAEEQSRPLVQFLHASAIGLCIGPDHLLACGLGHERPGSKRRLSANSVQLVGGRILYRSTLSESVPLGPSLAPVISLHGGTTSGRHTDLRLSQGRIESSWANRIQMGESNPVGRIESSWAKSNPVGRNRIQLAESARCHRLAKIAPRSDHPQGASTPPTCASPALSTPSPRRSARRCRRRR
jgi:hypothetical protein